jgi:DNA-binding NarL/FixJ family response regulator
VPLIGAREGMAEELVIASRGGAVGPAPIEAASTAFDQSYLRPLGQYTSKEAQQELARGWRAILNLELDQAFAIVAALEFRVRELPPPIKNRLLAEILPFLSTLVRRLPVRPISKESSRKVAAARRILSPRECSILQLIGRGMSNKRIAQELKIAPETVKSHAKNICGKLNAQTRAEAVERAIGLRLL